MTIIHWRQIQSYVYWLGVIHRAQEELSKLVYELNKKFTEPLKQNEVDAILRCVHKALDKFLACEQGLRAGEFKRVSKEMRDKGGYWYKNETLIERLDITLVEQKYLKTIISIDIKNYFNIWGGDMKRRFYKFVLLWVWGI